MLLVACICSWHHLCSLLHRNPLNLIFSSVYVYTPGVKKYDKPIVWAGWIWQQKNRGLINDTLLNRESQTCYMMYLIAKSGMWIVKQWYIPEGCEGNRQKHLCPKQKYFSGGSQSSTLLLFVLHVHSKWHCIVYTVCVYVCEWFIIHNIIRDGKASWRKWSWFTFSLQCLFKMF